MTQELAIATYGLTKQFDRHIAVNQVDLAIKRGEVYGLIGPNGAGKTTLIRMLAAAEEPTLGEIYLDGHPLQRHDSNIAIKQHIGYLPDDFPLYEDLNVWDYLDYFARLYRLKQPYRRRRLLDVLDLVQLTSKRHSPILSLSRGMKQRLSLARTIIHEPIILLLDEPVSGLDPLARMQFREIIKVLQKAGMTVLISSHVLSDLAQLCTSVGIMELGYLVESTSLPELYQRLSQQAIMLSFLGELKLVEKILQSFSTIEAWEIIPGKNRIKIHFQGEEKERAELLISLVKGGISVTEFYPKSEDLETIFLQLGHQQVS